MRHLQANAVQIYTRIANANELYNEMKAWHGKQKPAERPRNGVPGNSTLYDLAKTTKTPSWRTLHYLSFWLLHGRAGRPYNAQAWNDAGVLAGHIANMAPEEFWRWHGDLAAKIDTVVRLPRAPQGEVRKLHLVGIGALNIDTIVRAPEADGARLRGGTHFDQGVEHVVTREVYNQKLAEVAHLPAVESLGGSAFNVVQALSYAAPRLKLGYVGCVGADRKAEFEAWFDERGVDRTHLKHDDAATSASLSLIEGDARTLFTTQGDANDQLPRKLAERDNYDLIGYLARASCIHISSIFDPAMAGVLLDVLTAVKARSAVTISFDPGWVWCDQMDADPALQGLLSKTDILFLNPKEFERLSGSETLSEEAARRVLQRCSEEASILVYKDPAHTSLISWDPDGLFNHRQLPHRVLTADEIEDSTGAGDVLAAGILTHSIYGQVDYDAAMRLASEMVELKLRSTGTSAFAKFEGLLSALKKRSE